MSNLAQTSANLTSTPILDRVTQLPTRPKRNWKSTLLQLAIGLTFGGLLGFIAISQPASGFSSGDIYLAVPLTVLIVFFYLYASLFLCIIIHETGHLVTGLCSGHRVDFIRIGPIQINPPFHISWRPKLGIGAAGLASLLPGRKGNLPARTIVMTLGGPLANLISAGCVLLLPRPLPHFAFWFAGLSFLLGMGNLIPFVRAGAVSDGNRILMIWRRTPQGERLLAIKQLCSALWDGVLPENLDPELLNKAIAVADPLPDTAAGYLLAYSAAFHSHRNADAAKLLETALQYSCWTTVAGKEAIMIEAVIFQARRAGRLDLAERWLKDIPLRIQTPGLREQAEAAILEGQKEPEAAFRKLQESEQKISQMPAGFQRDLLLKSVTRWQNELKAHFAVNPVLA